MEESLNFIDKKLVHKVKDENNHIYNMRRALPREIPVEFFENKLLPILPITEQELVKEYYVKREGPTNEVEYILRTIPFTISLARAEKYLKTAGVEEDERKLLLEYYKLNEENTKYVLQKNITEVDEIRILKILDQRELHISDHEKAELADILEKIEGLPKKEIYFANIHIDQNHSYFFEHPQEHVPGMMLVEAARQNSMALCHKYGNVPLNAVFLLTKLNSLFSSYVELHFPVKMRAKVNQIRKNPEGQWSYYNMTFTCYQRNKESCTFEVESSIVKKDIFQIIRADREKYGQLPRFSPIHGIENNISIRAGGKRYLCSIIDTSLEGFMLQFEGVSFGHDKGETVEFFMFFDKLGFIHGKAVIIWKESFEDGFMAGFQIIEIGDIDKENLKEAFKFYFRVKEDREIL